MRPTAPDVGLIDRLEWTLASELRDYIGIEPPDVLYHYTSAAGLLGILGSGKVWLSDARFLNDQLELTYGRKLVNDLLSTKLAQLEPRWIRDIVELVARDYAEDDTISRMFRVYVASFCEDGNLLSQWRAYAGTTSGYALAFDAHRLKARARGVGTDGGAVLRRVEYDPQRQRAFLELALARYLQMIRDDAAPKGDPSKTQTAEYLTALVVMLGAIVPSLKAPVFEQEHEWRLILLNIGEDADPEVRFRPAANTIVPYIERQIAYVRGAKKGLLPLVAITHAPSLEPDLQKQALTELLLAYGYRDGVEVRGSDIPLRVV